MEEEIPVFDFEWENLKDEELENFTQAIDELERDAVSTVQVDTSRFPEVNSESIDRILDEGHAKTTKYSTKCHLKVFKDWASARFLTKNLEDMSNHDLDTVLTNFYAEARNQKGEEYSRSTLLGLRNSIERYLNNPPFKRGIKITGNSEFHQSNKFLDSKIKQLKKANKESIKHKPAVEAEDLKKLRDSNVLSMDSPITLLRNVWFHTTLYWCRRGREGQRSLTPQSFSFEEDPQRNCYVTMTHNEATKNHPGGINDVESFEKDGRMYQTNAVNDGYTALRLYITKLNPNCTSFLQYPKRQGWKPTDSIWYENRPMGVNKIGTMMSEISNEARLSRRYTNHSLRATAITLWTEAGVPNRHIMAISGHRNEEGLRHYNARPSPLRLQQCSNVLSRALQGAATVEVNGRHVQQQLSVENHQLKNFSGFFTSCNIQNVNISFPK